MNIIIKNLKTNAINFFPHHSNKWEFACEEVEAWQKHNGNPPISWQVTDKSLVESMTNGTITRL